MLALLLTIAADERLDQAIKLLDQQRFAEARPLLEANAADHPDDATALAWLAYAQVSLGDADAALATAAHGLELAPTSGALWYHRGRALLLRHEFADADAALTRSGELAPDFFPAWRSHFQALAALGVGDEPRARTLYAASPESKEPWADRAFLFERMAMLYPIVPDPEPARGWYRRAAREYFVAGHIVPPLVLPAPVRGAWLVSQSNNGDESHFGIAGAFGFDLGLTKDGRLFPAEPEPGQAVASSAYYGYDAAVIAPVDAIVVRVVDGLADNTATVLDRAPLAAAEVRDAPLGNHVVLKLAEDSFLLLAHLHAGTIAVKVGDRIKAGALVGKVGQSGVSYAPHLHLTALRRLDPPIGRPLRFFGVVIRGPSGRATKTDAVLPAAGEIMITRN